MFPHLKMTIDFWKTADCEDDDNWKRCARVTAEDQGSIVPDTLLPDGTNIGTGPRNPAVP